MNCRILSRSTIDTWLRDDILSRIWVDQQDSRNVVSHNVNRRKHCDVDGSGGLAPPDANYSCV